MPKAQVWLFLTGPQLLLGLLVSLPQRCHHSWCLLLGFVGSSLALVSGSHLELNLLGCANLMVGLWFSCVPCGLSAGAAGLSGLSRAGEGNLIIRSQPGPALLRPGLRSLPPFLPGCCWGPARPERGRRGELAGGPGRGKRAWPPAGPPSPAETETGEWDWGPPHPH